MTLHFLLSLFDSCHSKKRSRKKSHSVQRRKRRLAFSFLPEDAFEAGCISVWGPPRWLSCKESTCNTGELCSIPGSGRSPGGGYGNLRRYSSLEDPTDKGAWQATVLGVAKSQTWPSTHAYTHLWELLFLFFVFNTIDSRRTNVLTTQSVKIV